MSTAPGGPLGRSSWYRALCAPGPGSVREDPPPYRADGFTERHLQCVWADPTLRPARLSTHHGEAVTVEDPGVWNLEAGPDFLGAAVRLGPEQRRLCGDVEIHIRPGDWKSHRHHEDPRYRRVKAHVTFHPGTVPTGLLPPGAIQIALKEPLLANPAFSFEAIDLTEYPYAERATVPPCREVLRPWSPAEIEGLLAAAGEERIRQKGARLAIAVDERGAEQVLYEEIMAALGYKHNKLPFRLLARRLPLEELRAIADGRPRAAFALLAGVAGLLPDPAGARWSAETRNYTRELWDVWWKERGRLEARRLPARSWRLSSLRPANHPLRRLMAAAALFIPESSLAEPGALPNPAFRARSRYATALRAGRMAEQLARASDPFWDHHFNFQAPRQRERVSLIGAGRVRAILVNVLLPWLAARGERRDFGPAALDGIPPEDSNSVIRQTSYNLFGPDRNPTRRLGALYTQGLVQIFHDFCLNDRSRCAACPFPSLLATHRRRRAPGH
jgi:hypothetical protein